MNGISLRDLGPDDRSIFFALFSAVRVEELAMQAWEPALRDGILRLQFEAQRRGYHDQYPQRTEMLILLDDRPVGWAVVDRGGDCLRCLDIAIDPAYRRRGFGSRVFRAWQEEAAAEQRPIALSVLCSNAAARALYERLGFVVTRKGETHMEMEWRA